ncbi:hypothetical protein [Ruminococcus sp.]|uniref:hypothetical protein n=1 Tax=Ruminococcus sp. TaxID=41978 RepID=UPI003AB4EBB1
MDKKIKAFFAAMGIATALLVPVSASADNSDSKVQVSIDITWDSLEFTYTDRQWDPETHSYIGGGWSDSGGNFTLTNTGNVGVMADFSYKQAEGMDEIKGYFSSSELIVPISESRNSKLTLSGKPTAHFESMTVGTVTVNVTTDDSGDAGDSTITGWYKDEETGDWYYYDKNGKLVTGWFKDGGSEWYYADEDGKLVRGWFKDGGNDWYYADKDGKLVRGWFNDGGDDWYYSDNDGKLHTGWLISPLGAKGKMFYFDLMGVMQTGWYVDGNNRFYLGADGTMLSAWLVSPLGYEEGKTYYYDETGAMHMGWLTDPPGSEGQTFYFSERGTMVTGWANIGDYWYYFHSDGVMATDTTTDGKHLGSDGRWDGYGETPNM